MTTVHLPRTVTCLFSLGLLTGLMAAGAAPSGNPLDGLVSNSPFGQAGKGPSQPADSGNQPFEFRGVMQDGEQQLFSVFNTTTKKSRWVPLNAPGEDFVVKAYDSSANTISLEQNGQMLALMLKSGARVVSANPVSMPPPGINTPPRPAVVGQTGQPPAFNANSPEAQRLQQIAEEIRRRRAMRAQNPMPNPVPLQPGTVLPPPPNMGPPPNLVANPNAAQMQNAPATTMPLLPGMTPPQPLPGMTNPNPAPVAPQQPQQQVIQQTQ